MEMREFYEKRGQAFHERYYKQLEGATINKFIGMAGEDEYDQFPTFEVTLSNGQIARIEVSRDPEGNGGGFLFGLLHPNMSDWDKKQAKLVAEKEAQANA